VPRPKVLYPFLAGILIFKEHRDSPAGESALQFLGIGPLLAAGRLSPHSA
jgi:hypothetical protein